jgi:hypothetical protein
MRKKSESLGIEVIFIPKGDTKRYHPLDKRTFGGFKLKGKAKWRYELAQHYDKVCTDEA